MRGVLAPVEVVVSVMVTVVLMTGSSFAFFAGSELDEDADEELDEEEEEADEAEELEDDVEGDRALRF